MTLLHLAGVGGQGAGQLEYTGGWVGGGMKGMGEMKGVEKGGEESDEYETL